MLEDDTVCNTPPVQHKLKLTEPEKNTNNQYLAFLKIKILAIFNPLFSNPLLRKKELIRKMSDHVSEC